jgi:hypothetical protein
MTDKTTSAPRTAKRRSITVKVLLNEDEAQEIDRKAQAAAVGTRSGYLRQSALQSGDRNALAGMIGRVGLTLNRLEHAPRQSMDHISRQLEEIITLMRATDGKDA